MPGSDIAPSRQGAPMSTSVAEPQAVALDEDFTSTPEPDSFYEVVNGQIVEPPPMGVDEIHLVNELAFTLRQFAGAMGRVETEMLFIIDKARRLQAPAGRGVRLACTLGARASHPEVRGRVGRGAGPRHRGRQPDRPGERPHRAAARLLPRRASSPPGSSTRNGRRSTSTPRRRPCASCPAPTNSTAGRSCPASGSPWPSCSRTRPTRPDRDPTRRIERPLRRTRGSGRGRVVRVHVGVAGQGWGAGGGGAALGSRCS